MQLSASSAGTTALTELLMPLSFMASSSTRHTPCLDAATSLKFKRAKLKGRTARGSASAFGDVSGVIDMKRERLLQKFASASGSALVGGIIGALLAAFGNAISSSLIAVVVTILLATAIGGWLGRVSGAIIGGIYGALLAAFGSVIGGSVIGVVITIVGCALLGGWLNWINDVRKEERGYSAEHFRRSSRETIAVNRPPQFVKEHLLWN